jgi:predicted Zn-dependent protease
MVQTAINISTSANQVLTNTPSVWGTLAVNGSGTYTPGSIPGTSQVLMTGTDLSSQWNTIQATYNNIAALHLTYSPAAQNSDSVACTALNAAGVQLPANIGLTGGAFTPACDVMLPTTPAALQQFLSNPEADPRFNHLSDTNTSAPGDTTTTITDTGETGDPSIAMTVNTAKTGLIATTNLGNGTESATIYGQGASATLSNATITETANATATITSSGGDTINASTGDSITLNTTAINSDVINVAAGTTCTIVGGYDDIIHVGAGATLNISGTGFDNVIASGATVNVAANSEVNVYDSTAGNGNIVNLQTGDALGSSGGGNTLNVGAKDDVLVSNTGGKLDTINAIGDNDSGYAVNGAAGLVYLYDAQANIAGSNSAVYEYGGSGNMANVTANNEQVWDNGTHDLTDLRGTGDSNGVGGSYDLTNAYGTSDTTFDSGLHDDSNDYGSSDHSYQEGTDDIGYDANSSDTNYDANSTDTTTGSGGSGGGSSGGYYYYAGFAGKASTVAAAVGSNISSIAQIDLAQGNQKGALAAQNSLAEIQSAIALGENTVLTGSMWDQKIITYSIAGQGGKFSGSMNKAEDAAVQQAFATWGAASGLTFKEVSGSSKSDITVGFADFNTASTGVIGNTSYTSKAGVMQAGAVVQVEDGSQDALVAGANGQLTYAGTQATLEQALLHEIGHALGLADNDDASSIESYYLGSGNQTLSQGDITAIQSLYGMLPTPVTPTSISVNQLIQSMASFGTLPVAQTGVLAANQPSLQPPLLAAGH